MIKNRNEYRLYIKEESIIGSSSFFKCYVYSYLNFQPISRFLLLLRTCEYYRNCKKGYINKLFYFIIKFQKYKLGLKLGFTIPENVFDIGLQIPHYGTIVINAATKVGKNCRIHVCTNIGTSRGGNLAPIIGDNVYIGPGVKIYGNVTITSNILIAANAAVSRDFLEENIVIGGVPAKVISKIK